MLYLLWIMDQVYGEAGNKIQFRAIRYYLGVHPKTPLPALEGDMGWNFCNLKATYKYDTSME